jgi:hypothetical protein
MADFMMNNRESQEGSKCEKLTWLSNLLESRLQRRFYMAFICS